MLAGSSSRVLSSASSRAPAIPTRRRCCGRRPQGRRLRRSSSPSPAASRRLSICLGGVASSIAAHTDSSTATRSRRCSQSRPSTPRGAGWWRLMADPLLQVQVVSKTFELGGTLWARRWLHALDHVDLDIQRRSEEHTSELQSPYDLVCRLLPDT